MEYWSWWQGGLALGALTVLFHVILRRPLGVSGSWAIITTSRAARLRVQQDDELADDSQAMQDALRAATLASFGKEALAPQQDEGESVAAREKTSVSEPATFGQHAVFLLFIFIGGLLYALLTGRFALEMELSKNLTSLSHGLSASWLYLFCGGVMVGFGTQMASGCTSGHGLSGCAQLSPASLFATLLFFGSAVLTASFFMLALSI